MGGHSERSDHESMTMESTTVAVVHSPGTHPTTVADRLATVCEVITVDAPSFESIQDTQIDAVVLAVDQPETLQRWLESLTELAVPTLVAPEDGNERLAAAAVTGSADEYLVDTDDLVERVCEIIAQEQPSQQALCDRILARELPDEAFVITADGIYREARLRPNAAVLYDKSEEDLVGSSLHDVFPEAVADRLHDCVEQAVTSEAVQSIEYDAETASGRRHYEARIVPTKRQIDGHRAVVWLARDITERAEREAQLQAKRSELETVTQINAVISDVIETLLETQDLTAIERVVCEHLVDSELYCGAYVAEKTPSDRFSYTTGAGEVETFLSAVETHLDTMDVLHDVIDGETVFANRVLETEPLPEPLQTAASEDEIRAGVAVPIVHEGMTYGLLVALSHRSQAFGAAEREAFELLGETMGLTIMAIKNKQLLFSSSVVELEFEITDETAFCFDLSARHDCRCSLEWAGRTSGRVYQYLTVEGIDCETVTAGTTAYESIEAVRVIADTEQRCTLELELGTPKLSRLTNQGATIQKLTVEDGVGTCVVEVSQDADVRTIAGTLEECYDGIELVARRTVDRPVQTVAERRQRIIDSVTDRQLTALRLAYHGGYFAWPRHSTGEEIADAMGVSAPTMHQHLRKGLKTVLSEFFDH